MTNYVIRNVKTREYIGDGLMTRGEQYTKYINKANVINLPDKLYVTPNIADLVPNDYCYDQLEIVDTENNKIRKYYYFGYFEYKRLQIHHKNSAKTDKYSFVIHIFWNILRGKETLYGVELSSSKLNKNEYITSRINKIMDCDASTISEILDYFGDEITKEMVIYIIKINNNQWRIIYDLYFK